MNIPRLNGVADVLASLVEHVGWASDAEKDAHLAAIEEARELETRITALEQRLAAPAPAGEPA